MTFSITSVLCGDSKPSIPSNRALYYPYDNSLNLDSPSACYQHMLDYCTKEVLVYIHSDLDIHVSSWLHRIELAFNHSEDIVAVGFGGALELANDDLYRRPCNLRNMARNHYMSNQDDALVHGERFEGSRQVAVLDAFCMAVKVDWLKSRGGWPTKHLTHHCLDLWLACEAARDRKQIWMTGVPCLHRGGAASVGKAYAEASWLQGGTLQSDHELPHKWLYDTYRDVLPIKVK